MYRHKNYEPGNAALYLIPTPIGNLEDITYRAVRILKEVDCVYAEDTRVTSKLLHHYDIAKELRSFHEHNENEVGPEILSRLAGGENIGIVSDAGMPLLSDPGYKIVRDATAKGFSVVCLPGANAAITGLVMSGISPKCFTFVGFLDTRNAKRKARLEELRHRSETLVFYEAPHRIVKLLIDFKTVFPERDIVIAREISKKFEEIIKGKPEELLTIDEWKGEMVVIVEGAKELPEKTDETPVCEQVESLLAGGMRLPEATKVVADATGLSKNLIYREYLAKTKKQ